MIFIIICYRNNNRQRKLMDKDLEMKVLSEFGATNAVFADEDDGATKEPHFVEDERAERKRQQRRDLVNSKVYCRNLIK